MTITTIWEQLSLGNATDADGLEVLNPLDIRAVVNVNTDANQAKRYGILALPCDCRSVYARHRYKNFDLAFSELGNL